MQWAHGLAHFSSSLPQCSATYREVLQTFGVLDFLHAQAFTLSSQLSCLLRDEMFTTYTVLTTSISWSANSSNKATLHGFLSDEILWSQGI